MGSNKIRADIKIKCLGCNRIVMLPRSQFQKRVKKIIKQNSPQDQQDSV